MFNGYGKSVWVNSQWLGDGSSHDRWYASGYIYAAIFCRASSKKWDFFSVPHVIQ
jgi:hypothetical protein